jgi:hypothetical protein
MELGRVNTFTQGMKEEKKWRAYSLELSVAYFQSASSVFSHINQPTVLSATYFQSKRTSWKGTGVTGHAERVWWHTLAQAESSKRTRCWLEGTTGRAPSTVHCLAEGSKVNRTLVKDWSWDTGQVRSQIWALGALCSAPDPKGSRVWSVDRWVQSKGEERAWRAIERQR